jgi:PAS domain S-box-containing protein
VVDEDDERGAYFSNRHVERGDRRLALIVIILSALVFGAVAPFAKTKLPEIPLFVASYQSAFAINDSITAVLLFLQFGMVRARVLLLLAGGYLFTAGMAVVHAMSFPGLFTPNGLLESGNQGRQVPFWIYVIWHGGFPLLVSGYAVMKRKEAGGEKHGPAGFAILATVAVVAVAVVLSTYMVIREREYLPILIRAGRSTPAMITVLSVVCALTMIALAALWRRRPRTALDVWLMVVMCAWLFDFTLSTVVNADRYDVGFYVGRIYGLLAASFVLAMLLIESAAQQTQLARLLATLRRRSVLERDSFRERERLFSAAVESSNDAIMTKSLSGIVTGWNRAAEQLFGFSADEVIGKSLDVIVPVALRGQVHDLLERVRNDVAIKNFETVRISRVGRTIDVSLSISPVKSQSGQVIGVTEIARDLSETRQAQLALRQQIEERQRIFETSQDLIMVTDSQGNFVQVSPSSMSILGYEPAQMLGHSAVEFIHPDDLENTRNEMRSARRGRGMRNFATRYFHRDGRVVRLSWMGAWSEPAKRHFFIGRDMTEILLAQDALRDSERMARGIVETALDAFVQMDDAGTIMDWNSQAEKVFGWSHAEAVGRVLAELIVPEAHRARHWEGLVQYLQTGKGPILGTRFEIDAQRRDGKEIKVELSITALQRRGRYVFNGFIRDLTDKIAAEAQNRQAQKMDAIGQLTGGIAHDFNNILTVIIGTIEILADGVGDRPELAAIARMINEAAERGADLTKHLLAFARLQPLQPREVDVNALIVTAGKLLRPTLGEHIEIESMLAEDPWPAFVDPSQLTTAIFNLVLNARDAMPEGGKLIIETLNSHLDEGYAAQHREVKPGQYVMIAISDTGVGIPAELLDKVFEPFFTTKESGRGTGLGLSMVYGFVKQSGGHIKVYSEQGHGTTIKLYLPRSVGQLQSVVEAGGAETLEGGTELILVVEDDALVRNYVVAQVRSLGYRTLSAANADEALRSIQDEPAIDLLFTDVIMPGTMNGRKLAEAALKLRGGLKVLYTSGYTENAIVHHGRLDPGVLLLPKPYRKADLARMIRMALSAADARG